VNRIRPSRWREELIGLLFLDSVGLIESKESPSSEKQEPAPQTKPEQPLSLWWTLWAG
jgi:hypothetical protein